MFFSDKITIRAVVSGVDANGYPVQTNTDTEVWADVVSVTRAESDLANRRGREATKAFRVHVEDWNEQSQVVYGTKTYDIIRDFQKGLGIVELTCSDRAQ